MDSKQIVNAIESDDWIDLSGTVYGLRVDRAIHAVGDTIKSRTAKGGQDIGEVVLVDAVVVSVLGSL